MDFEYEVAGGEIRVIAHFPPGYYSYNPDHDVDWLMPEHFGNFS